MDTEKNKTIQSDGVFIDLSPKSNDLVDLAIEIWRIQNRINKSSSDLSDIHKRGLESSIKKLFNFLEKSKVKVIDHTGDKYNEGLNVNVLSYEVDEDIDFDIIQETVEPTVMYEERVIKKGKVIVTKNSRA